MFVCEYCLRRFSRKDAVKSHGDCRQMVQVCEQCGRIYKSEGALLRHRREKHPAPRRKAENASQPMTKKAQVNYQDKFFISLFVV